MKKILIAIILLCTVGMITFSFYVKNTYTPVLNIEQAKTSNARVSYDSSDYDQYFIYSKNMSYEYLVKNSDIVVEVTCMDIGTQTAYSILRNCRIEKVLQGSLGNQDIYIYEPSYVQPFGEISITNGYINMEKGETYILFLKRVNAPKNVNEKYSNAYYPISAMFGKYQKNKLETLVNYVGENDTYFEAISNHCTMLIDEKDLNLYNEIVNSINKSYNN